ncbi:MAG: hypothetical protein J6K58_01260 [Lachnospiraceae bacterium]|nr:hypothetical protein [Lachnospiraceae bacterium]
MPENEIRIWFVEKGITYRYNLDYTSIPALAENYNPSYMLTSPAIEAVCYETIEGVPEELTIEIYIGFCDRDIRKMIKSAKFKKGKGTLRNFVTKIVKKELEDSGVINKDFLKLARRIMGADLIERK